jgi:hypothetical protein
VLLVRVDPVQQQRRVLGIGKVRIDDHGPTRQPAEKPKSRAVTVLVPRSRSRVGAQLPVPLEILSTLTVASSSRSAPPSLPHLAGAAESRPVHLDRVFTTTT